MANYMYALNDSKKQRFELGKSYWISTDLIGKTKEEIQIKLSTHPLWGDRAEEIADGLSRMGVERLWDEGSFEYSPDPDEYVTVGSVYRSPNA